MGKVDLAGKLSDARARIDAETAPEARGLAKFARLTRKDARIRADQDAALTALAKSLMRRRSAKSERITENTLIRIAIDLLLANSDALHGSTEEDLRKSVTSRRRNARDAGLPESGTSEASEFGMPEHPQFGASERRESGVRERRDSRGAALHGSARHAS